MHAHAHHAAVLPQAHIAPANVFQAQQAQDLAGELQFLALGGAGHDSDDDGEAEVGGEHVLPDHIVPDAAIDPNAAPAPRPPPQFIEVDLRVPPIAMVRAQATCTMQCYITDSYFLLSFIFLFCFAAHSSA
jgi:hypothetical protein